MLGDVRFDDRLYNKVLIVGICFGFMARIISGVFDFNAGNVKQMFELLDGLFVKLTVTTIIISCNTTLVRNISVKLKRKHAMNFPDFINSYGLKSFSLLFLVNCNVLSVL